MEMDMKAHGADIPIDALVPLHERKINFRHSRGFRKIVSSVAEVGLIEPLCVYKEDGLYVILDGFLRYKACEELGIQVLPCLVFPDKEAYTFNRMVNRLSHSQQARMLLKSLESIDEKKIAKVFGLKSIRQKVDTSLLKRLHKDVAEAIDKDLISINCARELVYVKPERQQWIMGEMHRTGDYSISFVRALVLRTPEKQRSKQKKRRAPWDKETSEKQQLVAKLETIEKRYDFYTGLYRQYSFDLLRLCIYVRKLVANEAIRAHLEEKAPAVLQRFEHILFETQGAQTEIAPAEE